MANRKFRKAYLICADGKMFGEHNYQMVNLYRDKINADSVCASQQQMANDEAHKIYNANSTVKVPQLKVHGFYLVHESFFDDSEK